MDYIEVEILSEWFQLLILELRIFDSSIIVYYIVNKTCRYLDALLPGRLLLNYQYTDILKQF